ncbi:MAG TPA: hypothetical protein VMM92_04190 [Thermoanaerobaculia bacterium]|nr:hypothetical protein [Thermoanaerobaculia bacterium]
MSRKTFHRISLVVVLAASLSLASQSGWAGTARQAPPKASASASIGFLSGAWGHLVSLWERVGTVIDPNGSTFRPASNGSVNEVPHHVGD